MSFKRGVRLAEHKDAASSKIQRSPVPNEVVITLRQHIGNICEPLVSVGDPVSIGQKIADSKEFCSAPLHSPVNGTVLAIEKRPSAYGKDLNSIVIEPQGKQQSENNKKSWENLSSERIIVRIREAGIVGMGGAMFPTHAKLTLPKNNKVDTLLINGAECEPYITADHRLMIEYPKEMVEGVEILKKALSVKNVIIAVEDNKADAINIIEKILPKGIQLKVIPSKYPQGSEKMLIRTCLKRTVPAGKLPSDIGVIVQNVATAKAVYDAIVLDKPLIERIVTVSGDVTNKKNLYVKIGTPIRDMLADAEVKGRVQKVLMGGPMMGITQYSLDAPIIKGTNNILVMGTAENPAEGNCIKCAKCVDACPIGLQPNVIALFSKHEKYDIAKSYYAKDCFECGCCSYVCPQNIPLVQYIKVAKQ